MKLSLTEEVEDQRFRRHPESSLLETGTLCLQQLREPAEFCRAASPAHLWSEDCRQSQGHAIQAPQGGGVDLSEKTGYLENAVGPLKCHG